MKEIVKIDFSSRYFKKNDFEEYNGSEPISIDSSNIELRRIVTDKEIFYISFKGKNIQITEKEYHNISKIFRVNKSVKTSLFLNLKNKVSGWIHITVIFEIRNDSQVY